MIRRSLSLLAVSSFLVVSAAFRSDEFPARRKRIRPSERQIPAPTNLKVLPKDTTGPQVIAIMRELRRRPRRRVQLTATPRIPQLAAPTLPPTRTR